MKGFQIIILALLVVSVISTIIDWQRIDQLHGSIHWHQLKEKQDSEDYQGKINYLIKKTDDYTKAKPAQPEKSNHLKGRVKKNRSFDPSKVYYHPPYHDNIGEWMNHDPQTLNVNNLMAKYGCDSFSIDSSRLTLWEQKNWIVKFYIPAYQTLFWTKY